MLLSALLPPESTPAIPYLSPYLLTSFGSFTRMDYGTGHETSFALFLLCLTLIRFIEPTPDQERDLVLVVFLRYMRLCWKLQDIYKLEPAGSHGVWGLDDYSFRSYIFGSGQLRGSPAFLKSLLGRSANLLRYRIGCPCFCRASQSFTPDEPLLSLHFPHPRGQVWAVS